jgi:hypothetical protein
MKVPEVAKEMDNSVIQVLGSKAIGGFEKAYLTAEAIQKLQAQLTPEYMKPIMALQGTRLGFRTDKDATGGYPEETVKRCLIEAVLTGVQPVGNQFNIIAGNMYVTKEGYGNSLLPNVPGLKYKITPTLPRIDTTKGSAAIVMKIKWAINDGEEKAEEIDIPIRVNASMGADAVIGKATRKARAWLFATVTGVEIGDGEVEEGTATVVSSEQLSNGANAQAAAKIKLTQLTQGDDARIADINAILESGMHAPDSGEYIALMAEKGELEEKKGKAK